MSSCSVDTLLNNHKMNEITYFFIFSIGVWKYNTFSVLTRSIRLLFGKFAKYKLLIPIKPFTKLIPAEAAFDSPSITLRKSSFRGPVNAPFFFRAYSRAGAFPNLSDETGAKIPRHPFLIAHCISSHLFNSTPAAGWLRCHYGVFFKPKLFLQEGRTKFSTRKKVRRANE